MEKFKTLYGFIDNLKFLENCNESNNYTKDLLSELELILKEREEMLELLKDTMYVWGHDYIGSPHYEKIERLIKKVNNHEKSR